MPIEQGQDMGVADKDKPEVADKVEVIAGLEHNAQLLRRFWADDSGTSLHLHCADLMDAARSLLTQSQEDNAASQGEPRG